MNETTQKMFTIKYETKITHLQNELVVIKEKTIYNRQITQKDNNNIKNFGIVIQRFYHGKRVT